MAVVPVRPFVCLSEEFHSYVHFLSWPGKKNIHSKDIDVGLPRLSLRVLLLGRDLDVNIYQRGGTLPKIRVHPHNLDQRFLTFYSNFPTLATTKLLFPPFPSPTYLKGNIHRISSYTWLFAKNTGWFVVLRSNP